MQILQYFASSTKYYLEFASYYRAVLLRQCTSEMRWLELIPVTPMWDQTNMTFIVKTPVSHCGSNGFPWRFQYPIRLRQLYYFSELFSLSSQSLIPLKNAWLPFLYNNGENILHKFRNIIEEHCYNQEHHIHTLIIFICSIPITGMIVKSTFESNDTTRLQVPATKQDVLPFGLEWREQ